VERNIAQISLLTGHSHSRYKDAQNCNLRAKTQMAPALISASTSLVRSLNPNREMPPILATTTSTSPDVVTVVKKLLLHIGEIHFTNEPVEFARYQYNKPGRHCVLALPRIFKLTSPITINQKALAQGNFTKTYFRYLQ
jgi:hypothetical protein